MFRLTKKGEYAIRAVLHLASHHGVCKTEEIAQAQSIPKPFLKKIMQSLRLAGVISSAKGQKGGIILTVAPEMLSVKDIIEKVEGPIYINECTGHEPEDCAGGEACPLHEIWAKCQERIAEVLGSYKFSDLVKRYREVLEKGKEGEGLAAFPLPSVLGLAPMGGLA